MQLPSAMEETAAVLEVDAGVEKGRQERLQFHLPSRRRISRSR